jgi:hypothetical protein
MERQARTMDAAARAASLRAEVVREADIRQLQIRLAEMERRLGCAARMATHVIGQMTWMGPELEQLVRHVLQNWFVYGVAVLAIDRSDRPTIIEGYRYAQAPVATGYSFLPAQGHGDAGGRVQAAQHVHARRVCGYSGMAEGHCIDNTHGLAVQPG